MRKIYFLFFNLFIGLTLFSQAPITLTSANFPSSGDTLRYSDATLASIGNYTQTGANFNWNFSSLIYSSQARRDFVPSSQTPYFFFFLSFTGFAEKIADALGAGPLVINDYYNFYKKQTTPLNAFIADGSGMTFSSVPVPNYFTDKDELYVFPLTYPKYDSTTFKFSTISNSLIPIVYSKTGYRVSKVDGWGSVTTPYGTANCLRFVTTQYSRDTIKSTAVPFPIGFPNYVRSYQWLTASSKIPFLEISGNLVGNTFTPNSVKYRDIYQNPSGLHENSDVSAMELYPNPGKDKLWLNFTRKGKFLVEILDLSGKTIKSGNFDAENMEQSIDINDLSPSLYIIKVTEKQKSYFYKFIKE
ncbi:MAG: T9SS type A sorting domain-containing protein [Bacteroidota bacterium]|nr:T9SS type A sorting domain-containing protein [Bacteroidota bacterium]MDP3145474.1 T9SS type A sorting domain-containing protein [Bacteroidota bacterium]